MSLATLRLRSLLLNLEDNLLLPSGQQKTRLVVRHKDDSMDGQDEAGPRTAERPGWMPGPLFITARIYSDKAQAC